MMAVIRSCERRRDELRADREFSALMYFNKRFINLPTPQQVHSERRVHHL